MDVTYRVEGMTCGGCARSVTTAIERLGLKVEVSHQASTARVTGEHDAAAIQTAVEDAGFDFKGVAEGA